MSCWSFGINYQNRYAVHDVCLCFRWCKVTELLGSQFKTICDRHNDQERSTNNNMPLFPTNKWTSQLFLVSSRHRTNLPTYTWISLPRPSGKCHMTCQIGSEEPQWNRQHRQETQDGEEEAVAPCPSRIRRYSVKTLFVICWRRLTWSLLSQSCMREWRFSPSSWL